MWTQDNRPLPPADSSRFARILSKTPFAAIRSVDAELRKLALLRCATGAVCLARTLPIVWASRHYFAPGESGLPVETLIGLGVLGLSALATAGVAAPLTMAALLVYYPVFDGVMQTATLGTNFLCLMLGLLVVSGAGGRASVDALLLRRGGLVARPLVFLYGVVGMPSLAQLRQIYFLYFTAFAAINLGAVLHHYDDSAWQSGDLVRIIATSSYLSRFWVEARAFEAYSWRAADALSSLGALGQAAYQALMFPLIFTRWGARAVVAWGTLFFVVSLVALQLSYLPLLEILFWIALFYRPAGSAAPVPELPERSRLVHRCLAGVMGAALAAFLVNDVIIRDERFRNSTVDRVLYTAGLDVPNVFNQDDLRMGDAWPVIYRGDRQQLLPFHGVSGERLSWVAWNDLFYFGNSLRWRRDYSGPESTGRNRESFWRVAQVALYDHRRRGVGHSEYIVDYYATQASNVRVDERRRYTPRRIGSTRIVCDGTGAAARCE